VTIDLSPDPVVDGSRSRSSRLFRGGVKPPTIDTQTLESAEALSAGAPPLRRLGRALRRPRVSDSATTSSRRRLDGARRVRRVLLIGDALVFAGCAATALVAGSRSIALGATLWLVALTATTAAGVPADRHSARRALGAGALALGVLGVLALFLGRSPGGFISAHHPTVVVIALSTLAAATLRVLVRTRPVSSVLGPVHKEPLLLLGDRDGIRDTVSAWAAAGDQGRVVGACVVDADGTAGAGDDIDGVAVLGGLAEAPVAAVSSGAHMVAVLPGPNLRADSVRKLVWALEPSGIELTMVTPLLDVAHHRTRTHVVGRQLLVRVRHSGPTGMHAKLKSAADYVLSALLLVVALPLWLLIAAAVRLDSPGPVLFRQQRVREGGLHFTMLKFRTMHVDAEEARAALTALNDHGNGILFKMRHDPRVTRVGKVLRATSLDELPQLINVLRGEMSLVGPRPALPSEVEQYDDLARRRLAVKPGLTGLWQVSGRSNLSWEESLHMDLTYVDNWRHAIDFGILVRTVKAVLRGDGAC
jgi:exopolysaccharide biosynthesis polyprenyl glycosylphosphotransferase